jgi:hypothetical protein
LLLCLFRLFLSSLLLMLSHTLSWHATEVHVSQQ